MIVVASSEGFVSTELAEGCMIAANFLGRFAAV